MHCCVCAPDVSVIYNLHNGRDAWIPIEWGAVARGGGAAGACDFNNCRVLQGTKLSQASLRGSNLF